jgi:hypothetical protein
VWKRGFFALEYKGKGRDLHAALRQLVDYKDALENPPLLIVSDLATIEVHTNFTGLSPVTRVVTLDDLALPDPSEALAILRAVFTAPEELRPTHVPAQITETAARHFAEMALALRGRGHDPQVVAHFLDRILFCLSGRKVTARTRPDENPDLVFGAFLDRLRGVRVLDPACGSGNFLYIALQALKDLELEAIQWGSLVLQKPQEFPQVGPEAVMGIEINAYAAELARVTIWIGEIQWMLNHGFAYRRDPILRPLHNIEGRDALLDLADPTKPREAEWPAAEFVVGNPPFLGGKLLRRGLGDGCVDALFEVFDGRVPREADFVTYWHEKARAQIASSRTRRAGSSQRKGSAAARTARRSSGLPRRAGSSSPVPTTHGCSPAPTFTPASWARTMAARRNENSMASGKRRSTPT